MQIPAFEPVLPIGISFYTFQNVSYLADVYRRRVSFERSFTNYGMYISMFPQLIAGPIVTYSSVRSRIRKRKSSLKMIESGLRQFTIGLGLKVLIANQVGGLWKNVEAIGFESISTPLAWLGLVSFSLQIYFDFYGYSLMAKGLGNILGFRFPRNFSHPYLSTSMTEFWRRWHITLGSWFREYVYIPLGKPGRLLENDPESSCGMALDWILAWSQLEFYFMGTGPVPFDFSGKARTGETVCASSGGRTYLHAVCHSIHMDAVCHNGFIPDRNIFSAAFSVFGSGRGIYLFCRRFSEVCGQLRPVSVRGTDFYNAGSKEFI